MPENEITHLRPRHLARLDMYIRAVELGLPNPGYVMGYNEKMREREVKIFEMIRRAMIKGSNSLLIEITDSLEDICELCPKKEDPSCNSQEARLHDKTIAEIYGAEIGREYTPGELIALLHKHHKNALEIYHKISSEQ